MTAIAAFFLAALIGGCKKDDFVEINVLCPLVISTDPANLATNVPLDKVITATFNKPMNPATIVPESFSLQEGTTSPAVFVEGALTYDGISATLTFVPTNDLLDNTTYTGRIESSVTDLLGNPLKEDYIWTFSTGALLPPLVISTDPFDTETNVVLDKVISATFSEEMDPSTITDITYTVMTSGGIPLTGSVSIDITGTIASFTPDNNLLTDSTYIATITTGAQSNITGLSLENNYVWEFSTGAHSGPAGIDLKTVGRFGIISGVAVSNNAGASVINNLDVGIYPGLRSSITGFFEVDGGPGLINNGAFYAADDAPPVPAMLLQAKNDLVAAYLALEGATDPAPQVVAGDLGGLVLAPGIYKSASSMLIQSGNLTLDAQGDANAVWIFQIASDFTTVGGGPFPSPSGGNVLLTGGAQAKNVFWQVGSSAVIGDYTSFKGNVLALTSITMNAYSEAEGRMLTQNGAVTLTSTNIINKP